MKIQCWIAVCALLVGGLCDAEPLSMEPRIGLSSDFNSNPDLRANEPRAEYHGAVLLNLPVAYDLDMFHASVRPSARISDAQGFSSLASNYYRIDANARLVSELAAASVSGGLARETSLYHGGEANQGVGVRRDTRTAGFEWQRYSSERMRLEVDGNWSRTTYDHSMAIAGLADNRYFSVTPSLTYDINERTTATLSAGLSNYKAVIDTAGGGLVLTESTTSKEYNTQLSLSRQISEIWSASTSFGYSRSKNNVSFVIGPFGLGSQDSSQKSTIYDAKLARHGESFSFNVHASRAYRPSGSSFLSRYDDAEAMLTYQYSERWTFSGRAAWNKTVDPLTNRTTTTRQYALAELSATWLWKPQWLISLRALRIGQRYEQSRFNADANGVSLEFARQFHRTDL